MTDTSLVQGEFAPADISFAADVSVQSSPLDAVVASAIETDAAVTAEPNGFIELGLAPELVQAVADLGYTQPTGVQRKAIPLAMGSGNDSTKFIDLMVSSQTGSGKTAAFLLPVLHTLIQQKADEEAAIRAEYDRQCAEATASGQPTLKAMRREGNPFRGCLYFGLMLTENGPKVIEYNCRFGDPEAQAVLPLLQSDLFDIMRHVTAGTLADADVRFSDGASCCVVLASGGYPASYRTGMEIRGLAAAAAHPDTFVFHAGTRLNQSGAPVTAGGRVLGVTAVGQTLPQAIERAYAAADEISFEGIQRRGDIGAKAVDANRA